ncbi:NDH dependent flow 6 [Perilla frutescens var. hirtella]|uniref:NDH dependent flow 6 n=1 Tax=Perilla frutescens var. hirtella TaxID=608512 RepID=A0AAD4IZF3_PERFH|nr:NDH dependent flow 6 [Perilla frutescens var. frutescens]KAH6801170.1 NDH dependent flow 6 [Perilla frutescens var. hirtella]KAH6824375.1 NDH dependent flow 6 [Perilla frutescens var. hirtella]
MAETLTSLTLVKPCIKQSSLQTRAEFSSFSKSIRQCSSSWFNKIEGGRSQRTSIVRANALPDWPLMAVMVEHMEGQRDLITHKSIWHLSDQAIKNIYTFYIMFTCWGCCFFGSTKDPFYDSESYRGDGGDGTGHWIYEKQEDIEEEARAELWREELIEEIEQKVGGLRELEEAAKKEEILK